MPGQALRIGPPSEAFRRNWARLIQKVFEVDVLVCSHCQGRLRPVSFIEREDPPVIRRMLEHLACGWPSVPLSLILLKLVFYLFQKPLCPDKFCSKYKKSQRNDNKSGPGEHNHSYPNSQHRKTDNSDYQSLCLMNTLKHGIHPLSDSGQSAHFFPSFNLTLSSGAVSHFPLLSVWPGIHNILSVFFLDTQLRIHYSVPVRDQVPIFKRALQHGRELVSVGRASSWLQSGHRNLFMIFCLTRTFCRQIIMHDMDKMLFFAKNPWKQGRIPEPPKLNRSLFDPFEEDLERPEILILLGARQTGKTTLLLEMARRAITRGICLPENLYYFDLDTLRCQDVLASNRSLMDFLKLGPEDGGAPRRLVLIDEIQRLDNPGLFLKSVYDLHLPIKIVVTGYSTLEIRSRVRESLAGRSIRHFLWPLTLEECRGTDFEAIDTHLQLGGFPAVVIEENDVRRHSLLANLLASYLDRDIVEFLRVENVRGFNAFLQLLAGQTGQLVNLNELANTLALSRDTLSRHLAYLENTFMVRLLRPFLGNRRGELTKMPKVYFADLGLRNLLAGRLTARLTPADRGPLLENLVEILLRLDPRTEDLFFWRTRGGAEVDFVWRVRGGDLFAVEVKGSPFSRPSVPRSLSAFIKSYRPKRAALVAPGASGQTMCNGTPVLFLPPERVASIAEAA